MIDAIAKRIVDFLHQRSNRRLYWSITEQLPEEKVFLYYDTIRLTDIDAIFFQNVHSGNIQHEWIQWLFQANEYGMNIELQIYMEPGEWLLGKWVAKSAFPIYSLTGERIVSVPGRLISYREAAPLPEGACLFLEDGQMITPLAKDVLEKKQLKRVKRT